MQFELCQRSPQRAIQTHPFGKYCWCSCLQHFQLNKHTACTSNSQMRASSASTNPLHNAAVKAIDANTIPEAMYSAIKSVNDWFKVTIAPAWMREVGNSVVYKSFWNKQSSMLSARKALQCITDVGINPIKTSNLRGQACKQAKMHVSTLLENTDTATRGSLQRGDHPGVETVPVSKFSCACCCRIIGTHAPTRHPNEMIMTFTNYTHILRTCDNPSPALSDSIKALERTCNSSVAWDNSCCVSSNRSRDGRWLLIAHNITARAARFCNTSIHILPH